MTISGIRYGFADFESSNIVRETVFLPEYLWKRPNREQFEWLNKQIGGKKDGYTWHHTEESGKM